MFLIIIYYLLFMCRLSSAGTGGRLAEKWINGKKNPKRAVQVRPPVHQSLACNYGRAVRVGRKKRKI